ncbi:MAG: peptidyl-prolyl cis-trans isomerase [Candidatus Zixiibacteriota bacterium]
MRSFMKFAVCLTLSLAATLILRSSAASQESEQNERVLATVNGETINSFELDRELMRVHSTLREGKKETFHYRGLLDKLINDKLLVQEAFSLGLDQEEWLQETLAESRMRNAIKQYVADSVIFDREISEEAVLEYFLVNYSRMQIRSLSVPGFEDARRLAESIESGADMDSMANQVSADMYRYKGGLHNLKYLADIENVYREQALQLDVGELSAPISYRDVYSIIRLEKGEPADTNNLAGLRNKIKSVLMAQRKDSVWSDFITKLRDRFPVTVDTAAIANIAGSAGELYTAEFLEGEDRPVLTLDDDYVITESELRRKISHTAMSSGGLSLQPVLNNAIESSVAELALSKAVAESGYIDHPNVIEKYTQSRDSALIELYLKEAVVDKIRFNKSEFSAYYNERIDDFREPQEYRLDKILLSDEETSNLVVERLRSGADFAYLAKQYDTDPDSVDRKSLQIKLSAFPEPIRGEMAKLKTGDSSPAFQVEEGWVVFYVKEIQPGRVRTLDEVEMEIREVMFQREFDEILDNTLDLLKANSVIEYNDDAIEAYFKS